MPFSSTWKAVSKPFDTLLGGQTKYREGPSPQVSQLRTPGPVFFLLQAASSEQPLVSLQSILPMPPGKRNGTVRILPLRNFAFEIELNTPEFPCHMEMASVQWDCARQKPGSELEQKRDSWLHSKALIYS